MPAVVPNETTEATLASPVKIKRLLLILSLLHFHVAGGSEQKGKISELQLPLAYSCC